MKETCRPDPVKFLIGWVVVFLVRLIPFRPANVEPILSTLMPFSKRYGWIWSFMFGFASIILFDIATRSVGLWTWVTAVTYGGIGIWSSFYFNERESSRRHYVTFTVMGILVYDVITGVLMGPILFNQPFWEALTGQVPFTLRHLIGGIVFSAIASPWLYRWLVTNPRLETRYIIALALPTH